jgi:hypothetical protein
MTMNPTSDHLDDELLSALLDGDATGDPGAGGAGSDAAAHLRACDRCAARQAELAGARAAMADAPVEPLDDLARRRVVAAALAAAEASPADEAPAGVIPIGRARWARRHPALIGSVAATVLAVLVGVPFVLDNGRPSREETLTAQAPLQSSTDAFLGDLGDLSDRDRIRLRLSGAAPDAFAAAPAEAGPSAAAGAQMPAPIVGAAPSSGGSAGASNEMAASTTTTPAAGRTMTREDSSGSASKAAPGSAADSAAEMPYASDQSSRDRADTDACVAALLNGPARGGRLTRAGTGTYRGRPAIVASFELSGGTQAFITDRSGCAVLDRFSV